MEGEDDEMKGNDSTASRAVTHGLALQGFESAESVNDELLTLQATKIRNLLTLSEAQGAELVALRAELERLGKLEQFARALLPYRDFVVCNLDPDLDRALARLNYLNASERESRVWLVRVARSLPRFGPLRVVKTCLRRVRLLVQVIRQG